MVCTASSRAQKRTTPLRSWLDAALRDAASSQLGLPAPWPLPAAGHRPCCATWPRPRCQRNLSHGPCGAPPCPRRVVRPYGRACRWPRSGPGGRRTRGLPMDLPCVPGPPCCGRAVSGRGELGVWPWGKFLVTSLSNGPRQRYSAGPEPNVTRLTPTERSRARPEPNATRLTPTQRSKLGVSIHWQR